MRENVKRVIYGIDPGPEKSAIAKLHHAETGALGHKDNGEALGSLMYAVNRASHLNLITAGAQAPIVAIEDFSGFRLELGPTSFSTLKWIGRFWQAADSLGARVMLIERRTIKMRLCASMRAKDGDIARAVRLKLGEPGTKKAPGPTYGITGHCWQALAVAVVAAEILEEEQREQEG